MTQTKRAILNTSALTVLTGVGCISLLQRLFDEVVVPASVKEEFSKIRQIPSLVHARRLRPDQLSRASALGLGEGENQAIVLAWDLGGLLIIDDMAARKLCKKLGVRITGSLNVIRQGYIRCFIKREVFENKIRQAKNLLYFTRKLFRWALQARKP